MTRREAEVAEDGGIGTTNSRCDRGKKCCDSRASSSGPLFSVSRVLVASGDAMGSGAVFFRPGETSSRDARGNGLRSSRKPNKARLTMGER